MPCHCSSEEDWKKGANTLTQTVFDGDKCRGTEGQRLWGRLPWEIAVALGLLMTGKMRTVESGDLGNHFNAMIKEWKSNLNGSKKMGGIDLETQFKTASILL